jgi:RecA/RadA recombinase
MALSRQARPLTLQVIAEMLAGNCVLSTPSTRWTSVRQKLGVNLQLLISQPDTGEQALEM